MRVALTGLRGLPRLHVVTDDAVLGRADFLDTAHALLEQGGRRVAIHLRGHHAPGRRLHELGIALARAAASTGSALLVNDRIDVALAVAAAGVQLGRRSLPIERVRPLIGGRWIGYSAHSAVEALGAERSGTDFVVLGTIYPTASHSLAEPAGPGLVRKATAQVRVPVIGIGGVTVDRSAEVIAAGAYGVAVISGVWDARDAAARVDEYLAALPRMPSAEMGNDECGMMNAK